MSKQIHSPPIQRFNPRQTFDYASQVEVKNRWVCNKQTLLLPRRMASHGSRPGGKINKWRYLPSTLGSISRMKGGDSNHPHIGEFYCVEERKLYIHLQEHAANTFRATKVQINLPGYIGEM